MDIHLCGHVHDASVETLRRGGSNPVVTVVSGAAHGEAGPISHGYSFGALELEKEAVHVRVWPRYFYPLKQDFDRHSELLPRSQESVTHPLGERGSRLLLAGRESQGAVPASLATREASLDARMNELRSLMPAVQGEALTRFASSTLGDVLRALRRLALMKQTPELSAGAYYDFVLPIINARPPGSRIWAISTMMSVEWTDDPYEQQFLESNLSAADRGVVVERIFVTPASEIESLRVSDPIIAQVRHPGIRTWVVTREKLAASDWNLLGRIGPGILAFDEELVLVDRHSADGLARGFGTFMREDIEDWARTFRELRAHASPLEL